MAINCRGRRDNRTHLASPIGHFLSISCAAASERKPAILANVEHNGRFPFIPSYAYVRACIRWFARGRTCARAHTLDAV